MAEKQAKYTLYKCIEDGATRWPDAPYLLEPGLEPLTYLRLFEQVKFVGRVIGALDIETNQPVAIVMPNCGAMVTSIIGLASYVTCCPLNPAFTYDEFLYYLTTLEVKAVMLLAGTASPVVAAADTLKIKLLPLRPDSRVAGRFSFDNIEPAVSEAPPQQVEDCAMLSLTSGTTGSPKIVPILQSTLFSKFSRFSKNYRLTPADRTLAVAPLFYALGFNNSVLATLDAGASVVVVPFPLSMPELATAIEKINPTWLAISPPTVMAFLAYLEEKPVLSHCLRFIDTGGAGIAISAFEQTRKVLNIPLVLRYGLNEGSLTPSDALNINPQKTGSVGVVREGEVAILDEQNNFLEPEKTGEVVTRGPSVFKGYRNNPAANAVAFYKGWFRTGDLGYIDNDGYLYITGRIKEMINRGGIKIMPVEVDTALQRHPAVAEAATFAVPHPVLGEVVAAAVVTIPGQTVTEAELRSFLVEQIAYFKIPSRFIFTDTIPKNPTGKVERMKLAGFFELDGSTQPLEVEKVKPLEGSIEADIFYIWTEVLRHSDFGLDHNFFDLGGTSIEGAEVITLVQQRFARLINITTLVEYPTLRQFCLAVRSAEPLKQGGPLLSLQTEGTGAPLFTVHSAEGYGHHAHDLARLLAPDIPVYAFASIGRPGQELLEFDILTLAATYVKELQKIQPHGPYRLAGHSSGGWLAIEMANLLKKQGEQIEFLGMFDSGAPRMKKWSSPFQSFYGRHSIPFTNWLASALQPEAYADFSSKIGDGKFTEEHLAGMNWLYATWCLWYVHAENKR